MLAMCWPSPGVALRGALPCLLATVLASAALGCREREAPAPVASEPVLPAPVVDAADASAELSLLPLRRLRGEEERPIALAERLAHLGVRAVGVAVVEDGEVVERWARQVDRTGTLEVVDPAVLFPGGSLTSPVASALIASGVLRWAAVEGVDLESPVSRWLDRPRIGSPASSVPSSAPPTLAQVLEHSAGLAETPVTAGTPTAAALSAILRSTAKGGALPLVDQPGRRHRFSPVGALVLRELLVTRSGKGLPETMEELVLGPWGLTSTFFEGLPEDSSVPPVVAPPARAELWTTPSDLARWVAGLVVSARGVEPDAPLPFTLARRALEPGPGGWGWGVRIVEPGPRFEVATGENGDAVLVLGFVSSQSGAAIMATGDRDAGSGWLAREIALDLARERGWPGFETEELDAEPPASVARALVGRYRFEKGELEVGLEAGRLRVRAPAGVLGPEAIDQSIHPRTPLSYVFLDRPEQLDFVRTPGAGVRGLVVGDRRAHRVESAPAG
jgi:CubicO group peptidase (beta-lactamase class C family)